MFITRATRHDRADIAALLTAHGRPEAGLNEGVVYYARSGAIVGCIRLIEVEPGILVVDDLIVAESDRGKGVGAGLVQGAMNAKGGTLYVACQTPAASFFDRFGFKAVDPGSCPDAVRAYWSRVGEYPAEGGEASFLMAR